MSNVLLGNARQMHLQGRFSEAAVAYEEALRFQPDAVDALEGLGVLAYQTGRFSEAATMFARVTAVRPDMVQPHVNLAEILRLLKRLPEAEVCARTAIRLNADLPGAWNVAGLIALDEKRYRAAEEAFREAIRRDPKCTDALGNLGTTLKAQGLLSEAEQSFRQVLRLRPDDVPSLTNLSQLLVDQGDTRVLDEAEALGRRAVALAPRLPQASNCLGNVLRVQGKLAPAMEWYAEAAREAPTWSIPWHNMGHLELGRGRYDDATRAFERAHVLDADLVRYHKNLGTVAATRGQHAEAAAHFRLALRHDPNGYEAHQGLGMALLELGMMNEAEASLGRALNGAGDVPAAQCLVALSRLHAERGEAERSIQAAREALARRPGFADAYGQLAFVLRDRLSSADLDIMKSLRNDRYLPEETRGVLHFRLASIHDAQGRHDEAARLYLLANAHQAGARATRGIVHDPDAYTRFVDRIIQTFNTDFLARCGGWGDPRPGPVFVVGLPRAGTSMVEQILASHSRVFGAGELPCLHDGFRALPALVREIQAPGALAEDPFEALNALTPEIARTAARRYRDRLDALASQATGATHHVDKMPENLELLGWLAAVLPGARVIVCSRDPRDVALSCWQAGFATILWANRFDDLARRFADHARLVAHWRELQPVRCLEVRYEDLVENVEEQARRMVAFLGLEWESSCLDFAATRRTVRTASMFQVRQPAHTRSVGRWRLYEQHVPALFAALDRHGVAADQFPWAAGAPAPGIG